jgi:coatomer subunit beta
MKFSHCGSSNYIMNDLQSPNEYVRGMTLKFLTRIHDPEILESLIPSVRNGLVSF